MICDFFKISKTGESVLDLTDFNCPLRVQLKNDNVQGFEFKCDEVPLSTPMSKFPTKQSWKMCAMTVPVLRLKFPVSLY